MIIRRLFDLKKNKSFIKLMILIIVLFTLTGCNSQNANSLAQKDDNKKDSIIIHPTNGKLSTNALTIINKSLVDIDGEGQLDQIESFTSAKRMSDGTMSWDDGQRWVLLVTCNNQQYILFDDYIQLAELKFFAYTDSGVFHIATLQEGQSLTLNDYYFNKEKKVFVCSKKFSLDNAEKIYYPQESSRSTVNKQEIVK